MSEEHELPSDTDDDDDEDYVPEGAEEPVSEVESDGDVESGPDDENNENKQLTKNNTKKRRSNKQKTNNLKRKKTEVNSNNDAVDDDEDDDNKTKELTEEEEKKRADLLWADFMKDSDTTTKTTTPTSKPVEKQSTAPIIKPKVEEKKVKITKIFEFAGEEIKVEKEVPIDSAEARLKLSTTELSSNSSAKKIGNNSTICGGRRGGLGGLSSILSNIGKKTKISTLEKTKLDWDNFKRDEEIDEEITNHNRGKDGYLERQDFLQRTDVRQFEIEKNLRTTRRSNR